MALEPCLRALDKGQKHGFVTQMRRVCYTRTLLANQGERPFPLLQPEPGSIEAHPPEIDDWQQWPDGSAVQIL